ncbi:hypothetical protein HDU83_008870 [Entophlyctis luteolus]|nr:hypothetical protein HDU83_008870 [Entophlyctis luteolus]KAJ3390466.1 hypothetical protein HDU84_007467 [Entophlyctis sp. JEL0112]
MPIMDCTCHPPPQPPATLATPEAATLATAVATAAAATAPVVAETPGWPEAATLDSPVLSVLALLLRLRAGLRVLPLSSPLPPSSAGRVLPPLRVDVVYAPPPESSSVPSSSPRPLLVEQWSVVAPQRSLERSADSVDDDADRLVLLLQSLHSELSRLPLHSPLHARDSAVAGRLFASVKVGDLPASSISSSLPHPPPPSTTFSETATVRMLRVEPSSLLSVSVVYDANIATLLQPLSISGGCATPLSQVVAVKILDENGGEYSLHPSEDGPEVHSEAEEGGDLHGAGNDDFSSSGSDTLHPQPLHPKLSSSVKSARPLSTMAIASSPTLARRSSFVNQHAAGVADVQTPSASFVGSYEESLLTGRMSSHPSKPLAFVAEISAVAVGRVKSRSIEAVRPRVLRIRFDAWFYDYGMSHLGAVVGVDRGHGTFPAGGGVALSPYVGNVDVEGLNGLIWDSRTADGEGEGDENDNAEEVDEEEFRANWIGGYRVPARGQLRIIIKNTTNTAVKMFHLPYDFRDMPPNTKTFLRQKTYISARRTSTSTVMGASQPQQQQKERLYAAVHVHFECSARRRIYVTRAVRVVFSHRGVDSDETTRTVMEAPHGPHEKYTDTGVAQQQQQQQQRAAAWGLAGPSARFASMMPREVLSVSPGRRISSGFGGGGVARRSSFGALVGSLGRHVTSGAPAPTRGTGIAASVETLRQLSLQSGRTVDSYNSHNGDDDDDDDGAGGGELLFTQQPLPLALSDDSVNVPRGGSAKSSLMWAPPIKSSLSIALSMSSNSASGASTPGAVSLSRSRVASVGCNGDDEDSVSAADGEVSDRIGGTKIAVAPGVTSSDGVWKNGFR